MNPEGRNLNLEFLAAGEACTAIFGPAAGIDREVLITVGSVKERPSFKQPQYPTTRTQFSDVH